MRTQIFINNEELDLIKDIDAEFTFAIMTSLILAVKILPFQRQ